MRRSSFIYTIFIMARGKNIVGPLEPRATRDGYGEALVRLGEINEKVVVLTADLSESTRVLDFSKKYPDRFVECGVAEQNMMGIAAGLASAGKIPFVSSYAVFSPGRNWDQLRVSVAMSGLPVKIIGAHTGLSVGPDGATHQALEDMAMVRVLPKMTVVVPCDATEARKATMAAAELPKPVYLRLTREKTPIITDEQTAFKIGRAEIFFSSGTDAAIVACGPLVFEALDAAKMLTKDGWGITVVNNHTIKPIDSQTLIKTARNCGCMVTVEEHQMMGGMGSAIAEVLVNNYPIPIEFIGMPDCFGESGTPDELQEKYGMKSEAIQAAVKQAVARKKSGGD